MSDKIRIQVTYPTQVQVFEYDREDVVSALEADELDHLMDHDLSDWDPECEIEILDDVTFKVAAKVTDIPRYEVCIRGQVIAETHDIEVARQIFSDDEGDHDYVDDGIYDVELERYVR